MLSWGEMIMITKRKSNTKADKAGDKPKVALDAKALGSLYAGRIYLQSTKKVLE